ncbi:MAG: HlyD family efflux transporter periplasmic adaptor subunit [Psychrobium sp.]|nr:HlyD family efflux transporter periplasmic adaptor subunit [Psychrobium sp.]
MKIPTVQGNSRLWLIALMVLISLPILALTISDKQSVDVNSVRFAPVEYGTLDLTINGFGKFVALDNQILTAPFTGTIRKLHYRAGDYVTAGANIVELENRQIVLAFQEADSDWQRAKLKLAKRKLELEQQRQQLQASLRQEKAELAMAQLNYQAKQKLFSQQIIPELEMKRVLLQLHQQQDFLQQKHDDIKRFKLQSTQSLALEHQGLTLAKQRMLTRKADRARLIIKAPFAGRLDNLRLFPGQSLQLGEKLAVIKGESKYTARAKIPQRYSAQLKIGQRAELTFIDHKISALVSTILPGVKHGFIELELTLLSVPQLIKEDMEVKVAIVIETLEQSIYVTKPTGFLSSNIADLFVKENSMLRKVRVNILRQTDQYLVLASDSLSVDSLVVVSDTRAFTDQSIIELEDKS